MLKRQNKAGNEIKNTSSLEFRGWKKLLCFVDFVEASELIYKKIKYFLFIFK